MDIIKLIACPEGHGLTPPGQPITINFDLRGPVEVLAALEVGPYDEAIASEGAVDAICEYLVLDFPFPVRVGSHAYDETTGRATLYVEHADVLDMDAAEFVVEFPHCSGPSEFVVEIDKGIDIHLQLFTTFATDETEGREDCDAVILGPAFA